MSGRLGILGGAFDPPHVGHVALARAALERLGLERLLVLVAADPGHKPTHAPAEARLEMARAAFAGLPGVEVELDLHPRTIDSLEARGVRDAVLVLGADELADFPGWKDPEGVLERVRLAVAARPGVPDERVREARARLSQPGRVTFFAVEPHPVSSTEIRARVARGEPVDGLVPPAVAAVIARRGLYRGRE
ncbi:MAG TPA: nicotinate-nicotinamide nucleotide adenylyltransferase [Gaiellaceae bacterium]|nr:nicotinate-nicotinamide nucleotide adenylyltransferase [Gaiellaceae bacterium]